MNTVYTCLFGILFSLKKCEKLFVKKYTTVEIACPLKAIENKSVTWHFEKSTIISDGNTVNPMFMSKYSVIKTRNLQIFNVTDAELGRYTCYGLIGREIRPSTVTVTACNVPNELSSLSSVLKGNISEGIHREPNALCTHNSVEESGKQHYDNNGKYLLHATLKLHISHQCNLENERGKDKKATIWTYTCLTLNEDQCVTSNEKFLVNVEWISKEDKSFTKKSTGLLQKQLDVYTGNCASLNIKTNSNCDENIQIYLTNDMHRVLYLNNFNKTVAETFLCHIYKVDNFEEITKVDHADINFKQLTYAFGGIAAVLTVLLSVAGAVIKAMTLKINRHYNDTNTQFACDRGILRTDGLPMAIKRKDSIEDEHNHDEDVVPDNLATADSVNHHSIDVGNCSPGRNSASNPTLSGNASSYYLFDVSENSHTEAINEQKTESVNNTDNYFNNCFENDIYSASDLYVNTNVINTYEQLEKNNTTDIQTYEDFSYDH